MTRRRFLIQLVLSDLFFFGLLNMILASGLYLIHGDAVLSLSTLLTAIPFFAMLLIRQKAPSFLLFILLHLPLVFWPLWLISDQIIGVFLFVAMASYMVYSVFARVRGGWQLALGGVVVALAVDLGLNLMLRHFRGEGLSLFLSVWGFVFIVCYIVSNQMARVDNSLDILSGAADQATASIRRFNNGILLAFLLAVAVAALLSVFVPVEQVVGAVGGLLLALIRWVMSKLPPPEPAEIRAPEVQGPSMIEQLDTLLGPPDERPQWLLMLEEILKTVVLVAIAAGVLIGISVLIYRLYKRFYATKDTGGDLKEYIGPSLEGEALRGFWRSLRRGVTFRTRSEGERIRRQYYKKVRRHIKKGVAITTADTAGEIGDKIRRAEDIDALTAQYEQARYSRDSEN